MEMPYLYEEGPINQNKNKFLSAKYKTRGRSKSLGNLVKVCWKCGKEGHLKKDCRSKSPEKGKGFDDTPSI